MFDPEEIGRLDIIEDLCACTLNRNQEVIGMAAFSGFG